mmetsp:Transcript_4316/g.12446  ORF Transcript_4316/g.12446 Transcript_4316/m.12446 type:complete len:246 (-) Transcript_4316:785-1522(-)
MAALSPRGPQWSMLARPSSRPRAPLCAACRASLPSSASSSLRWRRMPLLLCMTDATCPATLDIPCCGSACVSMTDLWRNISSGTMATAVKMPEPPPTTAATHAQCPGDHCSCLPAPFCKMKNTLMNTVNMTSSGSATNASRTALSRRRMSERLSRKLPDARMPEMMGDENHEMTIGTKPARKGNESVAWLHTIASEPCHTSAKPMIAPMLECVVETAISKYVATVTQIPAAASAHIMPYMYSSGN